MRPFPELFGADQGASIIANPIVLQSNAAVNVVSVSVSGGNVASLEFNNTVSGPGILTMGFRPGLFDRRGTLILSAANTYTAGTVIEQGAVRATGSGTLGTGNVLVDGATTNADAAFDTYGVLILESTTAISDTAYLNLTGGGTADVADRGYASLLSGGNETVGGLMLGGKIIGTGTYGSSASGASGNANLVSMGINPDEFFDGSGTITVAPVGVPGDYNANGIVDGADYVLWRNGGPLQHDFTPGVQQSDYDFWRSRFAATTNPGSGNGLGASSAVPEPSMISLVGLCALLLGLQQHSRIALQN